MANEITASFSLTIKKGHLLYQSAPTTIRADFVNSVGPSPGSLTVTTAGVNVDLTQIVNKGGWVWLQNTDDTNYVTYGIWDSATSTFYPFGELRPGEISLLRLSRNVGTVRLVANTASCVVRFDAFEA